MKKKSTKKEKITMNHLAELMSDHTVTLERISEKVEENSKDIRQNSLDIKNLNTKIEDGIDSLADSTKKGFEESERKFEQVLEGEMGTVNYHLEQIDSRLQVIENVRYNSHETRIENLEDDVRKIKQN